MLGIFRTVHMEAVIADQFLTQYQAATATYT